MEMNDYFFEYHTVGEFLTFCVDGPVAPGAGKWASVFPSKYLEGGKAAGGLLVDQRLCPRIKEGEVHVLTVGDVSQVIIHKMPTGGGLSDTVAYYTKEELVTRFKQTIALQPRVLKQYRGSAGVGIWLCWLQDELYCKKFGEASPTATSSS